MEYIGDNAMEVEPVETDNIGSLARLVLSELSGCPDVIVRQQLGFALREFCRETDACTQEQVLCWRDGRELPDGKRVFLLANIPSGMELHTVLGVESGGHLVHFDAIDGIGRAPSVVVGWMGVGDRAVARYSVCPKVGGESCPRWFKERYAEAIVAGAMFHALSMAGRGWSDPQRAAQYGGKYRQAIDEAAYRRMSGSLHGSGEMNAVPSGGLFM